MSDLYNRIYALCQKKGISVGKMCTLLGISRGNMTELKMERIKTLKADNLTKISGFFDVTVDYLLYGKEKAPAPEGERQTSEEDLKLQVAAFWGGGEDLSKEELDGLWSDAEGYYKFKLEQLKKSRSKQ